MAKQWQPTTKPQWTTGRTSRIVTEWRQREARETLHEIARQEGLDWLVREVLVMVKGRE